MANKPTQKKSATPQSGPDREEPLTEPTTKTAEPATQEFVYPELPQAHAKALNFYSVYTIDADGVKAGGSIPCIMFEASRPFVRSTDDPFLDPGVDRAVTFNDLARMEFKKRNFAANDRKKLLKRDVRVWQHILYKTRHFYEDPEVAAAGGKPRVYAVSLFCPAWGVTGTGATERHGVYLGLGDPNADHPAFAGMKPGYCPKCNHKPEAEAAAVREIADLYHKGGKDIPDATADRLSRSLLTGGQA